MFEAVRGPSTMTSGVGHTVRSNESLRVLLRGARRRDQRAGGGEVERDPRHAGGRERQRGQGKNANHLGRIGVGK